MYKIGLCSVTFRHLTVEQVIQLASDANLEGIEWGGDIHVPPGDMNRAAEVAALTERANLELVSYGSYYRLGHPGEDASFETILKTTQKLKAPAIRVWAGKLGSAQASEAYWESVIADAERITGLAGDQGITINLEYHGGTLTDIDESAQFLMEEINNSNVNLYWQPAVGETVDKRLESIARINKWLTHIHVFHWDYTDRRPFVEGVKEWESYLHQLKKDKADRYLLMEFVKNDEIEQYFEDVKVLKKSAEKFNQFQ